MKFIPNKQSWIGVAATLTGTVSAPKVADVTGAVDLTKYVTGMTASSTGNAVPTPTFDTDFETSISGTVSAQFSMDGYRDDGTGGGVDLMWSTLPRGTNAWVILARYGGKPSTAAKKCEVWPIEVTSRSVPQMTSGAAVMVNVIGAVPSEPGEDAVVAT